MKNHNAPRDIRSREIPPALMRPAPFWSWNDKLDETELRRQVREMAAKGWGSFFMHSRVGLVTGYLSEEWFSLINACADEAAKTGIRAWLYDEDKWPSGFAGGLVPEKNEAFRPRALVLLRKGVLTENDTVLSSLKYRGVEYEICKRVSPLGNVWFNGASYVDLMNPAAVREFLNSTHRKYKEKCGQHFGKTIPGVFTDEPAYIYYNDYPVPAVPWSEFLPGFFRKMKGCDLQEKLPLLFFDLPGYRKTRFDFYDAASELFKRNFTKQYHDWCRKNNLLFTGHFMAEDHLWYQTQWSGDVMAHYEFMDWPGVDKLGRNIKQLVTVKQVSSAADQLGKERTLCECFGGSGREVSFFHRKWIGDWQAALGINFVNHHLAYYSMRGERKRDWPPSFFYQQPWWENEKEFADYQARLCETVSGGKRLVELLVLQPLSSVWCEYSPLHKDSDFSIENTYDVPFERISRLLLAEKLDFHYGSENLMAKYGSVEGPAIKVGNHSYTCVVVPPASNIRSTTLALFQQYLKSGGRMVVAGTFPWLVEGEERDVKLDGAQTAGSVEEAVRLVSGLFPERIKVTDRRSGENVPSVYAHSRKTADGGTRHLFVNTDEKNAVEVRITIPSCRNRNTAVVDLAGGKKYKPAPANGPFDLTLDPAGSVLFSCGNEAEGAAGAPLLLGSGAAFGDAFKRPPDFLVEKFDCRILEENVLTVGDFILDIGGKTYRGPVNGSLHAYFYPAADGTPFSAVYSFRSEINLKGCFAVIEVAENLEAITFNGAPLKPLKKTGEAGRFDGKKSWKDVNFTKVPLPEVGKGTNVLVIKGKKVNNITGPGFHRRVPDWKGYNSTEAEKIFICGRFSVKREADGIYAMAAFKRPAGKNLTGEGFPFYAGRALFISSFPAEAGRRAKIFVRLNGASAAGAEIRVNGKKCGTVHREPWILEVTEAVRRSGKNTLEIETAPTLANVEGYESCDFGLESAGVYVIG